MVMTNGFEILFSLFSSSSPPPLPVLLFIINYTCKYLNNYKYIRKIYLCVCTHTRVCVHCISTTTTKK